MCTSFVYFQRNYVRHAVAAPVIANIRYSLGTAMSQSWRSALPILSGSCVTVREICESDAVPLYRATASPELREFVKAPPSSVEGFGRFIARSRSERAAGRGGAFAIIPAGDTSPVGLFQINVFEDRKSVVEWGFVLAV